MSRRGAGYGARLASALAVLAVLAAAGCSSSGVYTTTPVPKAAPSSTPPSGATSTPAPAACGNALASFAPSGPTPAPGAPMPAGSYMKTIQDRGRLIAGAHGPAGGRTSLSEL